jgi:hypothetical protein
MKVHSAVTHPAPESNPKVVVAMRKAGIEISQAPFIFRRKTLTLQGKIQFP